MGDELTRSLTALADRGVPRGADDVLEDARCFVANETGVAGPPLRRGFAVAVGAAAAALVLIGASILLIRPLDGTDSVPVITDPSEVVTTLQGEGSLGSGAVGQANYVQELSVAGDGALWAATNGGVVSWDTDSGAVRVFTEWDGLPTRVVSQVANAPNGDVWVGDDEWLARFDGTWTSYTAAEISLTEAEINDIAVGSDGTVWVAAGMGLRRFDGSEWVNINSNAGYWDSPSLQSIAVAQDGTVWAAAHGGGPVRSYDGDQWRVHNRNDGVAVPVANITVAPDGTVWVGGEGSGISSFDGTFWTTHNAEDGLATNQASVVVGADGGVWTTHSYSEGNGSQQQVRLSHFDGKAWTTHPATEGASLGGVVGSDGTLWMPSQPGVVGFDGTSWTRLSVPLAAVGGTELLPVVTLVPDTARSVAISSVLGEFEFTSLSTPTHLDLGFWTLEATPYGLVSLENETLRWSADNEMWHGLIVPGSPWKITTAGDDIVLYGGDVATRYTWDDGRWSRAEDLALPGRADILVFGPRGAVATVGDTMLHSSDGVHFSQVRQAFAVPGTVEDGPSVEQLLATESGFVAFVHQGQRRAYGMREPLVWFSADGVSWRLSSAVSPFGARALVDYTIAQYGGTMAATGMVGDRGALWVSSNGLDWSLVDINLAGPGVVAGGELGWTLVDNAAAGQGVTLWFSEDAVAWYGPHPLRMGLGTGWVDAGLVIGSDALFGAGAGGPSPVVGRLDD